MLGKLPFDLVQGLQSTQADREHKAFIDTP